MPHLSELLPIRRQIKSGHSFSAEKAPYPKEKDYHEHYDFFLPQIKRVENAYFPSDSPAQINHKGFRDWQGHRSDLQGTDTFRNAREYLAESGVSEETIDMLYAVDGKRIPRPLKGLRLLDIQDPDIAAVTIAYQQQPEDEALQKSVDHSLPNGFNRHMLDHRNYVRQVSHWLLQHAQLYREDISNQAFVLNALASEGHDYGLTEGRAIHSLASEIKLRQDNPGIEHDQRFPRLAFDIIVHDPPRLKEYLTSRRAVTQDGTIDPDKASEVMQEEFSPEAMAIMGADRAHIGPTRVPEGISLLAAFDEDPNIFPNMVWTGTPAIIGDTYYFSLDFNTVIDPKGKFAWAGRPSKKANYIGLQRIHVPQHMHDALKNEGIPYSVTAEKDWMRMYGKDFLTIQIAALFALNPHLKNFQLVVRDPLMPQELSQNGRLTERIHTFRRGHIAEDLHQYKVALGLEQPIQQDTVKAA